MHSLPLSYELESILEIPVSSHQHNVVNVRSQTQLDQLYRNSNIDFCLYWTLDCFLIKGTAPIGAETVDFLVLSDINGETKG